MCLLKQLAGFLKAKSRPTRIELTFVSIAEIAKKISLPFAVREELGIHLGGIEAGHWTAIHAQGTRRKDEICALEGTVAKGCFVNEVRVAHEQRIHIVVRKQPRELFVELSIPGDDDVDGGGSRLLDVTRSERWC